MATMTFNVEFSKQCKDKAGKPISLYWNKVRTHTEGDEVLGVGGGQLTFYLTGTKKLADTVSFDPADYVIRDKAYSFINDDGEEQEVTLKVIVGKKEA